MQVKSKLKNLWQEVEKFKHEGIEVSKQWEIHEICCKEGNEQQ